ncbi:MAG: DUF2829 domain-containing protein [Candidatus Asgardarchaeia archaeon]
MEVEGGFLPIIVFQDYLDKHKPVVGGYWVKHKDGHESFSPAEAFESGYTLVDRLPSQEEVEYLWPPKIHLGSGAFGQAIQALKEGKKVSRSGWNGKGMWLKLMASGGKKASIEGDEFEYCDFINMKTADNKIVPWLASQTDMLSEDWGIIE